MNTQDQETESKEANNFLGYPLYPFDEDIYSQFKKEESADPENISQLKTPNETENTGNKNYFGEDHTGNDLDVREYLDKFNNEVTPEKIK